MTLPTVPSNEELKNILDMCSQPPKVFCVDFDSVVKFAHGKSHYFPQTLLKAFVNGVDYTHQIEPKRSGGVKNTKCLMTSDGAIKFIIFHNRTVGLGLIQYLLHSRKQLMQQVDELKRQVKTGEDTPRVPTPPRYQPVKGESKGMAPKEWESATAAARDIGVKANKVYAAMKTATPLYGWYLEYLHPNFFDRTNAKRLLQLPVYAQFGKVLPRLEEISDVTLFSGGFVATRRCANQLPFPGNINPNGYYSISIKGKNRLVHRLIALAAHREQYDELVQRSGTDDPHVIQVDHVDGNKRNNSAKNLRWLRNDEHGRVTAASRRLKKARKNFYLDSDSEDASPPAYI